MYALFQFLQYILKAKGAHGVHSPFVYELVTKVLPYDHAHTPNKINDLRKRLLQNSSLIEIQDFGAGYNADNKSVRQVTIQHVAKNSGRDLRTGSLLHRIIKWVKPNVILELGTNLGLSGLYMATAAPAANFITIEGSETLAGLAKQHFQLFKIEPQMHVGTFEQVLGQNKFEKLDVVFLDGHHKRKATLQYFQILVKQMNEGGLIILDDIYWSKEMTQAWKIICRHPSVSISIDLFSFGLVFIDKKQAKQHFVLRFL